MSNPVEPDASTAEPGSDDAVRVRRMRWWDIEEAAALERGLFPGDAWSVEAFWGELAKRDSRYYLVARAASGLVGYAGLLAGPGEADVLTLAVAPTVRRNGLGRRLLGELLAEAERRGCTDIHLEVRADNAAAVALYAREGFERVGVRRRYYADGTDAWVLRRRGALGRENGCRA